VVDSLNTDRVIIGGKSMGGRIASLIADEIKVAGLVVSIKPSQARIFSIATTGPHKDDDLRSQRPLQV
jgi:predicted alpha/beta-hydrolase family hydrolase